VTSQKNPHYKDGHTGQGFFILVKNSSGKIRPKTGALFSLEHFFLGLFSFGFRGSSYRGRTSGRDSLTNNAKNNNNN
jgi:hypothetical protein